jgi:superfamily I DNA/RNA helicase
MAFLQFCTKVVSHLTEKIKVHGGPGCGKTSIIKDFYQKYLLCGYESDDITVLTFRKTAAYDLINATFSYAKVEEKELKKHVGTIHSICYRLIGHPETMRKGDYNLFIKLNNYGKYLKKSGTGKIDAENLLFQVTCLTFIPGSGIPALLSISGKDILEQGILKCPLQKF